jgi:hypothetical protein
MVFSQSTTDAFLAEMSGRFSAGNPRVGDTINNLLNREGRLRFGLDRQGNPLEARVIFSPHITGDPTQFAQARTKVLSQLVAEAKAGRLQFNSNTGHPRRPKGGCVFCTMMQIGPCDYETEIRLLTDAPSLTPVSLVPELLAEKQEQSALLEAFLTKGLRKSRIKGSPNRSKTLAARAAPATVLLSVEAGVGRALQGSPLSGNPTRPKDREPSRR